MQLTAQEANDLLTINEAATRLGIRVKEIRSLLYRTLVKPRHMFGTAFITQEQLSVLRAKLSKERKQP